MHTPLVGPLQDTSHLAIETTGRLGSVAVFRGQEVLRYTNMDPDHRTAATLAPAVDETLNWCKETNHHPKYVSVAAGPGSFTGLRIGVTTAKTLCYALNLPLVSVDSLAAIAAAALHSHSDLESILVAVDAYRGQIFTGTFSRSTLLPPLDSVPETWTPHPQSVHVVDAPQWQQILESRDKSTALAGDRKPLAAFADQSSSRKCDAIGVGLLAARAAAAGQFIDPLTLTPKYLKPSAAEEAVGG